MGMQFSGVGSGLPVNDWIDALMYAEQTKNQKYYTQKTDALTQKTTLNTVESKFSMLRSSIEKLTDGNITQAFDLFGRMSANSSDSSLLTASVSNNTAIQSLDVKITQLATATKAESTNNPGLVADGTTKISEITNGSGEEGTFSLYVNNEKFEFTIAEDATIQDVIDDINGTAGLSGKVFASITNGKFKIDVNNTGELAAENPDFSVDGSVDDFRFGATTDTSNFLSLTQLARTADNIANPTTPDNIEYVESSVALTSVNTSGNLITNESNLTTAVTAGTFTIGDSEFEIKDGSTIDSIVVAINSDTDSGAYASYDVKNNKLILTARDPGAISIDMEDGTSNFLESMGLTSGGSIAAGSQTLGQNALAEINGNVIESASNTLGADSTGISGLTLNLLGTTSETDPEKETVEVNISQNSDDLVKAVEDFISKFNTAVSEIDKNTDMKGTLHSEYSLIGIRNDIRMTATGMIAGASGEYQNMADIGISTGKVGAAVSDTTNHLKLDKDKFLEALAKDPEQVKALLIGDSDAGITGMFQTLETKVEGYLDIENGYFAAREDSLDTEVVRLDDTIERAEFRLEEYRKRLVTQFAAMDKQISQMQQQMQYMNF